MKTDVQGEARRGETLGSQYIPGLDGLRALSVIVVIFGHAGIEKAPASLGVTVFFFISGFLITRLLLQEANATGSVNIKSFYARRYLRLMPELALYVLAASIASIWIDERPRPLDAIGAIFYFTNYINIFGPTNSLSVFRYGHFWSLSVEEHFYLTWPVIIFLCNKSPRRVLLACTVMLTAPIALRILDLSLGLPAEYVRFASETRFDSIAYGCLLASAMHFTPLPLARLARIGAPLFALGIALVLFFTFGGAFGFEGPPHEVLVYTGQGIGLFFIFTYIYASNRSIWILNILELIPLRYYGKISYGVYIWHFFAVYAFARLAGYASPDDQPLPLQVICGIAGIIISGFLGAASLKWALGPFRRLRRHFGAHI